MPPTGTETTGAVSIAVTVDAAGVTATAYPPAPPYTPGASVTIPTPAADDPADDPAAAVAAVVTAAHTTTTAAGGVPIQRLAVAIPPDWTGRHRDLLRRACHRGGLPAPSLVTRPAALAHHIAPPTAASGGYLLVVATGTGRTELTVLAATGGGFDTVAHRDTQQTDPAGITATANELLAAADLTPTQLERVVLAADQPTDLAPALQPIAPVTVVADRVAATTAGALRAATTDTPADPTTTTGPDHPAVARHAIAAIVRPQPWYATAVLAAGVGSFAVLGLTLSSVEVYSRPTGSYLPAGYAGFTAAALLFVQTAVSVAAMAATAAPALTRRRAASLLRQAYPAAAGIGLAVAAIYGLFATALLDLTNTPIMTRVLYPCLPVAATITGLTAATIDPPRLPAWLRRTRPAQTPVLLFAAGMLLVEFHLYTARPVWLAPALATLAGWVGGGCLGAAIAITATGRNRILRAICVVIGVIGVPLTLTLDTTSIIVTAYTLAVAWAWLLTTATTLTTAYPTLATLPTLALRHLRRLTASRIPSTQQPAEPSAAAGFDRPTPTATEVRDSAG